MTQNSVDKTVANGMTVDEAIKVSRHLLSLLLLCTPNRIPNQVLNFEDIPPKSSGDISARAKTIFDINAPNEKEAGSPYLQAKVYWARIRLEHAVKHGEITVAKDDPPVDTTDASAAEPAKQQQQEDKKKE